jgi:hypothetical protein
MNNPLDSQKLIALESTVGDLKKSLESAFPKDEDGNIDYTGHRTFHRKESDSEKRSLESLTEFKRNIITWAIIGLITLVASALARNYLDPFLALISK